MSRSQVPVVKIIAPEIDINSPREYTSLQGAQLINSITFSTQNPNNANIQITAIPPSQDIIISRRVLKKFVFAVTITGTNTSASPTLLQPGFHAPRAFPITAITQAENIMFNNESFTLSPVSQVWPPMFWYSNDFDLRNELLSMTQTSLDKFQSYADGIGSNMNPLTNYFQSSYEQGRASVGYQVVTNSATSATLVITSIEPLLISPLVYAKDSLRTPGLIGINNVTYQATLANINRVMSLIPNQGVVGINITSVTTQVTAAALEFVYLTPPPIMNIPKLLVNSYYQITPFTTQSFQTAAPGQNIGIQSNSVQLTGIPKRIFIYCGNSQSTIAGDTIGALSDSYLSLAQTSPVSVNFNNVNYFQSYTQEQLYQICVKNGLEMSFAQWCGQSNAGSTVAGYVGSVLCLDPATDFGLNDVSLAPGVGGNFQFSINTNWLNCSSTYTYTQPMLYITIIYEGTMTIDNGQVMARINPLMRENVLVAQAMQGVKVEEPASALGGGFFDTLGNVLSTASKFLGDTKLISTVSGLIPHPLAQGVSAVSKTLGYGRPQPRQRSNRLKSRIRGAGFNQYGHEQEPQQEPQQQEESSYDDSQYDDNDDYLD